MVTTTIGQTPTSALAPFVRQQTILLTSYRRDATPVCTPVSIAVEGDHAYIHTYDRPWKTKRMRRNPEVTVAPSTTRGQVTGAAIRASARLLEGEEAAHAARALVRKHPLLHGVLVPLSHRLARYRTLHFAL